MTERNVDIKREYFSDIGKQVSHLEYEAALLPKEEMDDDDRKRQLEIQLEAEKLMVEVGDEHLLDVEKMAQDPLMQRLATVYMTGTLCDREGTLRQGWEFVMRSYETMAPMMYQLGEGMKALEVAKGQETLKEALDMKKFARIAFACSRMYD